MLRNQASALIRYGRIQTTVAGAKELRPFVERLITLAKRSLDAAEAKGRTLHARRSCRATSDRDVVEQAVRHDRAPLRGAPGGYTRLLRLGYRRGDSAEVAEIELLGSEYNPNADDREDREASGEEVEAAWVAVSARRPSGCAARRPTRRRSGEGEGRAREEGQNPLATRTKSGRKSDTRGKVSRRPPLRAKLAEAKRRLRAQGSGKSLELLHPFDSELRALSHEP